MITIIVTYCVMGILSAYSIMILGNYKSWGSYPGDPITNVVATLAFFFWPIVDILVLGTLFIEVMDNSAKSVATRIKNKR